MKFRLPLGVVVALALILILFVHFRPGGGSDGNGSPGLVSGDTVVEGSVESDGAQADVLRDRKTRAGAEAPTREQIDRVFTRVGEPAVVRPFPRGRNGERRYHEVTVTETSERAREAAPLSMARLPEDGRLQLLKEEEDLHTGRSLRMILDVEALESVVAGETANLLLPLPDGSAVEVRVDRIRNRGGMTFTLEGEIPSEKQSSVVQLVFHDDIVHGSLARYDLDQHIEYTILASGHMAVRELDASTMIDRCGDPGAESIDGERAGGDELSDESGAPDPEGGDPGEPFPDTPGYVTMDVVVGYGREARIAQGGVSQMEARIISSVDRMNTAFGNSLVANTELMLLGTIEDPDYVFPGGTAGSMSTGDELGDLNNLSNGNLDTVSDYATELGADLRSFIVKQADGSAGIAYRPGRSSITARDYMTSNRITFVHELGHNIGARHSWGDNAGDPTTLHNYGWRLDPPASGKVRTVMAYDWGWTRIPYFANPLVEYLDARTGQVDGYDATGDVESDQRYVSGGLNGTEGAGFDGSKPSLGARNADYLEAQAPSRASQATRAAFAVAEPVGGATWDPGATGMIYWRGGDYSDAATVELYKGGVFNTSIATGLRGDEREQSWAVPSGQAPGSDYMIRVTLNGVTVADSGFFTISSFFPSVLSQAPGASSSQAPGQSQISVTFSEAMDPGTFSQSADIVSFTGPQGVDLSGAISGISWSGGNTVLTVNFASQSANGIYRLVLGPDIRDLAGEPMDQDLDGLPGESVEDRYAAILWISSGGASATTWSDLVGTDSLDGGWTLSGGSWETGTPTETPTAGPSTGADGNPILAQNLGGDYGNGEDSYAESPVIDCAGSTNVALSFEGWKGAGKNDTLYVDVFDGSSWQRVFSFSGPNGGDHDTAWTNYSPSVSAHADGNANFRIRWGLIDTTVGNSAEETGWQIDAIVVTGDAASAPPPAPLVLGHSPSGASEDPQSSVYLEFSQPMDPASFALGDIASFSGPLGPLSVSGSQWVSDTLLRLDFAEESVSGVYSLTLDPTVLDDWGQQLDQDVDSTAGEAIDDQYTATFTITGNTPPTGLGLSPASIEENEPAGSVVGSFSTTDAEGGSYAYTLVSGAGDADNASFSIAGSNLLTTASFDYETKNSYSIRVRTTDSGSLSLERAVVVTVTDIYEPPPPNAPTNLVATAVSDSAIELSWSDSSDDEAGFRIERALTDTGPWSQVGTTAANAMGFRNIGLDSLTTYFYQVKAASLAGDSDPSNVASATTFAPNTAPTGLALAPAIVAENEPAGTPVGTFATTDGEGGSFNYALVAGSGDVDNASFTVSGDQLLTAASFDYEAKASYTIRVSTTDFGSLSFERSLVVTVTDVGENEAPTGLVLSPTSVPENEPAGTLVGSFATTDAEGGSFAYTLVSGVGDTGNSSFSITGDQLVTTATFDYETTSSYSIRVRTTDDGSLGHEKTFIVTVTDVGENEAPTGLVLSPTSVPENEPAGTLVGSFATTDAEGGSFAYTLVSGVGDTGNSSFSITGDQLVTAASFDYETTSSYSIRVRTTDDGSLGHEKTFIVTVTDVGENEAPTGLVLSPTSVPENEPAGTLVGSFATTDAEGGSFAYTLVSGVGDTGNSSFSITGDQLVTTATFDYETTSSYSIRVRTTDDGSLGHEKTFIVTVTDVGENEAPTGLVLSPTSVPENEPAGTLVGSFAATDAEGGSFAYALVSGVGDTGNSSFSITGDQLLTTASFDYETTASYSIRVRTTDDGSLDFERILVITVTDVLELSPPDPPSGLVAMAVSGSGIDLSWTDSSDNEDGFKVQRASAGGGPWSDLMTTAAEVANFSDTGLAPGTTWFYRVIASNVVGDSTPSNTASATTWTFAESWRDQYFGQTANTGVAADLFDADGDGSVNLLERAFATVPNVQGSFFEPFASVVSDGGNDYLAITYRRRQGAGSGSSEEGFTVAGMRYTVRRTLSVEAGPWETGSALLQEVSVVDNLDGTDSVTVRSRTPVGGAGKEFLRLEVTAIP